MSRWYCDDPYYVSPEEEAKLEADARCDYCDGSGFFYSEPDLGPCNCVLDADGEPELPPALRAQHEQRNRGHG